MLFYNLVKGILNENVSIGEINAAIDKHQRVIITYHTNGKDYNIGPRMIEVYAYGLTKAGNPVIRSFEPYGDTTTKVPRWKFFRLDRISSWKPTKQSFNRPADFFYKGLGEFNPNGDETMSIVYKIADFNDEGDDVLSVAKSSGPKLKHGDSGEIFKTDTERNMERLRQQLDNPVTLDDLKKAYQDGKIGQEKQTNSPSNAVSQKSASTDNTDVFKTDTEKRMEHLRQQLNNPMTLDNFKKKQMNLEKPEDNTEISDLQKKLGDTTEPMSFNDLNQRLSSQKRTDDSKTDVFKTDTEKKMENLRQQLTNPKKIDLSRIPKR